jgi:hypothetical protein
MSIRKVLNAIRLCSCGSAKEQSDGSNDRKLFQRLVRCRCIGPKSWSELLRLTGLHLNTLGKTCKFLVKRKVLTRTVLRRKGHYVVYSINKAYDSVSELEVEYTAKERRQFYNSLARFSKVMSIIEDDSRRFHRRYRDSIDLLKARSPVTSRLPFAQYRYLVRLIDRLGEEEGLRTFLNEYQKRIELGPLAFIQFASNEVFGKRKLKRVSTLLERGK